MNSYPWNRLATALVLSIIISLGISFTSFEVHKDTNQTPQSTTFITPYEVFLSGVHANIKTGETGKGTSVQYGSAAANILILFVPLALLSLLIKKPKK